MAYTILIGNQKGGVGKTTTTVTLGHGLTYHGYRVLLVDLDSQGHVAVNLGLEKASGVSDLLVYGKARITGTGRDDLYLIPGNKETVLARQIVAGRSFREMALQRALSPLQDSFDFILLDTPPGLDVLTISAIMAATHILVPVALEELALDGLVEYTHSILEARQGGARCDLAWVVPTMYDRVAKEIGRNFKALAGTYPEQVAGPVPRDAKMREAPAYGQTIWEYASKSRAAVAYAHLVGRVLSDLELEPGTIIDEATTVAERRWADG
jgi:chromosome partitioning protein